MLISLEGEVMRGSDVIFCECGREAEFVDGRTVYPHRDDLWDKWFWRCVPCDARVGMNENTGLPTGSLATADARSARRQAFTNFDEMCARKARRDGCALVTARRAGQLWMADKLGLDPKSCRIEYLSAEQCWRVVEICRPFTERGRENDGPG